MPSILVVDDRSAMRDKVVAITKACMPEGTNWDVIGSHPLTNMEDFLSFIVEEDVVALMLDEQLHEQMEYAEGEAVTYDGHDLVAFLRKGNPELPLFVVTSFAENEELIVHEDSVEAIISRNDFLTKPSTHVVRIVRAAQRFSQSLDQELSQLGEIAEKVALGNASEEDVRRGKSLQTKLSLAHGIDIGTAADFVPLAESLVKEAKEILAAIKAVGKNDQ